MADNRPTPFAHFGTLAVHTGQDPKQWNSRSVVPPIFTTTTFQQDEPGKPIMYDYTRGGNPTRTAFEKCLAACEDTKHAFVFSSGLTAVSIILQATMKSGDHVVSVNDVYGGTNRYFRRVAVNSGLTNTLVDATDLKKVEEAIQPNTKLVWIETPTNPTLRVVDIKAVTDLAHKKGCLVCVDNTFLSPYFQRPIMFGADLILHSITKYIGGHCDVLMGAVCTSSDELAEKLRFLQMAVGSVPGPFDCYLANRGLKTLHVRMRQHEQNAFAVAQFLLSSPYVEETIFPGLPSHPQHELAKRQCTGFGGMVSFRIKGTRKNTEIFVKNVKVFVLAESLGGIESLCNVPSLMTHASVPEKEREQLGITDTLIRLSVGIEDAEDIVDDLKQALEAAAK